MKVRTGIDIASVERFKNISPAFIERVFTPFELEDMRPEHLAGVFAAKEAFIKASGITVEKYHDLEIQKSGNRPVIIYSEESLALKIISCDISISHETEFAVACASLLIE